MVTIQSTNRAGFPAAPLPARQRGVTLLITLIVLVAMTLAAIALVRSVDTSNVIAGNLAFRQTTTLSGDRGTEAAIAWLEANNSGTTLNVNQPGYGYFATHIEPVNQSWDDFWTNNVLTRTLVSSNVVTLPADAAGNTVSYQIDRLCEQPYSPTTGGADCQMSTVTTNTGSSQTAGTQNLLTTNQVYYRITSRISGPHNAVAYVQAIVAM